MTGSTGAESHFDVAGVLHHEGRFEQAIVQLDEAIRLAPGYAAAYYNRGVAYEDLGQHERAIQDYDEAIRLAPDFAQSYVGRAVAHTRLNNDEAAQRDVERAVELGFDAGRLSAAIESAKRSR